tara:strand:+ start:14991 stop:15602 length:612 start_codon:yes stop_codon:yes gene_type:complete
MNIFKIMKKSLGKTRKKSKLKKNSNKRTKKSKITKKSKRTKKKSNKKVKKRIVLRGGEEHDGDIKKIHDEIEDLAFRSASFFGENQQENYDNAISKIQDLRESFDVNHGQIFNNAYKYNNDLLEHVLNHEQSQNKIENHDTDLKNKLLDAIINANASKNANASDNVEGKARIIIDSIKKKHNKPLEYLNIKRENPLKDFVNNL